MTEEEQYEEDYQEFVNGLIADGCFTDDGGEEYGVDWERLSALHPAVYDVLWADHCREIDEALKGLTDSGLLEMSFREKDDGELEEVYALSDMGREYIENYAPEPRG